MSAFRYGHGDRPLEGYTIQRAVGRGGFGEVYYAVSDSGREVALKVIQTYEQIELRGVSQCMNLKSPHLVSIFDVKHNPDGLPFVIMEYVAGPSLRDLLDESPAGLGPQKAAFFLREIAKGLTFLHDRGIVHRDLKPGNIFYEDGYVKIGDYGLSKAISASHYSGQTITVGTVHYMAPEIGQGRYDQGIDIYALGVVLYEMLTGQTPYLGATPGEILMKHLMSEPGVSAIEEPFATVIRKAMAKDPADRYKTAQEMVEAIFGSEHVRNSVSHFRPESLSVAAERVGQKVALPGAGSSGEGRLPADRGGVATSDSGPGGKDLASGMERWGKDFGRRMSKWGDEFGRRMTEWGEGYKQGGPKAQEQRQARDRARLPAVAEADPTRDPLDWNQRRLLGIVTAAVIAAGSAFLCDIRNADPIYLALFAFTVIAGAGGGVVGVGSKYLPALEAEGKLVRNIAFAGVAAAMALIFASGYLMTQSANFGMQRPTLLFAIIGGVGASIVLARRRAAAVVPKDVPAVGTDLVSSRLIYLLPLALAAMLPHLGIAVNNPSTRVSTTLQQTLLCVGAGMLLADWRKLVSPGRVERLSLGAAFGVGITAWVCSFIFHGDNLLAGGIAAGIALVAQVTSPFDPQARRRSARPAGDTAAAAAGGVPNTAGHPRAAAGGFAEMPSLGAPAWAQQQPVRQTRHRYALPAWARFLCILAAVLLWGTGLMLFAWVTTARGLDDEETALSVSFGIGSLFVGLFFFILARRGGFRTLWGGIFRPLLLFVLGQIAFTCMMLLAGCHLGDDDSLICLAGIIFPSLAFLALLFTPAKLLENTWSGTKEHVLAPAGKPPSQRRRFPAVLLACAGFMGIGGLHRFYAGRKISGVIWLVTLGLLYLGTVMDLILLLAGVFADDEGRPLLIWYSDDELPELQRRYAGRYGPTPMVSAAAGAGEPVTPAAAYPSPNVDTLQNMPAHSGPAADFENRSGRLESSFSFATAAQAVLTMIGGGLLWTGLVVGILTVTRSVDMIAAGWPDPSVGRELAEAFGTASWPQLVNKIGYVAWLVVTLSGLLLIAIARRNAGTAHIVRAVLGTVLAFVLPCLILQARFETVEWFKFVYYVDHNQVGPALDLLTQPPGFEAACAAVLTLVISGNILLVWGRRRPQAAAASQEV